MSYLKKTGLALTLGLALTPAPSLGADFPVAFPTCEAASYVDQGLRPVLVSLADGRAYLYVDTLEDGKVWERTRVYDLTGKSPRRVPLAKHFTRRADIPEDYAKATRDESKDKTFYILADPGHFQLSELDQHGLRHLRACKVGARTVPRRQSRHKQIAQDRLAPKESCPCPSTSPASEN